MNKSSLLTISRVFIHFIYYAAPIIFRMEILVCRHLFWNSSFSYSIPSSSPWFVQWLQYQPGRSMFGELSLNPFLSVVFCYESFYIKLLAHNIQNPFYYYKTHKYNIRKSCRLNQEETKVEDLVRKPETGFRTKFLYISTYTTFWYFAAAVFCLISNAIINSEY